MRELRLTAAAREDLIGIRLFGNEAFGPEASNAYFRGLLGVFATLRAQPLAGRPCHDLGEDIRCLTHRRHRLFYRIDGERLLIARVLHHARDIRPGMLT